MQHKLASGKYFIAHANGLLFNCASCSKLNASEFICFPCIYHHHAFFVFICFCANIPREKNKIKWKETNCRAVVSTISLKSSIEYHIADRTIWWGIKVGLKRHKQQTTKFNNALVTLWILFTNCSLQCAVYIHHCSFSAVPVCVCFETPNRCLDAQNYIVAVVLPKISFFNLCSLSCYYSVIWNNYGMHFTKTLVPLSLRKHPLIHGL